MTIDESLCEPFVDIVDPEALLSQPMREMRNALDIHLGRALRITPQSQMASENVNVARKNRADEPVVRCNGRVEKPGMS